MESEVVGRPRNPQFRLTVIRGVEHLGPYKETDDESERRNGGDSGQLHFRDECGCRGRNSVESKLWHPPNSGFSAESGRRGDRPRLVYSYGNTESIARRNHGG